MRNISRVIVSTITEILTTKVELLAEDKIINGIIDRVIL